MLKLSMVREGKQQTRKTRSLGQDALRRLSRNNAAVVGGIIIVALFIVAVGAQWIAPYGYTEGRIIDNYLHPTAEHLMGCDFMGRDVLSRLIFGARVSLSAAFVGAFTSFFIGVTYGLVSGFSGGKVDIGPGPFSRPLILGSVKLRTAHPVPQRQIAAVANAHAALFGGIDQK